MVPAPFPFAAKHRILTAVQPVTFTADDPAILVFRNGKIGNTLMALPVLDLLRERFPRASLDMVVDGLGRQLLQGDDRVDRLFVFERRSDSLRRQWELVRQLRSRRRRLSLHLRTGVRNEILAFLARIPNRAGTRLKGSFQLLTHVAEKREDLHVHEALRRLVSQVLGEDAPLGPPRLQESPPPAQAAEEWLQAHGLEAGRFLLFHPAGETVHGAEWALRWQAEAMRRLSRLSGLPVAVMGTQGEREAVLPAVPQGLGAVSLFGEDLSTVSSVIRRAALFVGNDSGPAHLAEAWSVPKVVLYRDDPANFVKWAPLDRSNSLALFASQAESAWETVEGFAADRLGGKAP